MNVVGKTKRQRNAQSTLFDACLSFELAKWKLVFEEPMLAGTKIWNACVWESSEAKKRGKPYPSESEMKALLKNQLRWKDNSSQTSQAIVEEYFEAVRVPIRPTRKNGHSEMNLRVQNRNTSCEL